MSRTPSKGNIACVDISRGPTRRVPKGTCPGKGIDRWHWLGRAQRVGTPLVRKS